MQRDVYAALIKKKGLERIPLRILQLSGDVTEEQIFSEVFQGYKLRRVVLMTNMAGTKLPTQTSLSSSSSSTRPPSMLPCDIVVEDFAQLKQIHQPHFQYKLLPLLCQDLATFQVMQAIASANGSPFTIDHRRDSSSVRLNSQLHGPKKTQIAEYLFNVTDDAQKNVPCAQRRLPLPPTGVFLDGMFVNSAIDCRTGGGESSAKSTLLAESLSGHCGVVCTCEAASEQVLREYGNMMRLIRTPFYHEKIQPGNFPLLYALRFVKHQYNFLGVRRRLPGVGSAERTKLLAKAKEEGIFLYEPVAHPTGPYQFVQ